jgi:hypothetical protein
MRARLAIVLVAGIALAAVPAPAPARAADPIIARDTMIQAIWPLGGDLVYLRGEYGKPLPKRRWMARFRGRLHVARGIPRRAGAGGDIGRDAKGRKVFPFSVDHSKGGVVVSRKWFLYDLARNRTRPLGGLPTKCLVGVIGLSRDSIAYTKQCKGDEYPTVFLRKGKRTQQIPTDPGAGSLTYRDGTLAVKIDTGLDNLYIEQWAANGEYCRKKIAPSDGDATSDDGWYPNGLTIVNGHLTWIMGYWPFRPDFAILAAKVGPGCQTPGPVGLFPFKPPSRRMRVLVVGDGRVFYADNKTLRRQAIPATPTFDPPPNDDFEAAQQLSGKAPLSAKGRVAYATLQPGEPLAEAKHTVWYAYRPMTSGTVYVTVSPSCWSATPEFCGGLNRFGVYTGTSPATLTELPPSGGPYTPKYTRVDAVAGKTYWISVGSPGPEPNYEPFTVRVDASPPG